MGKMKELKHVSGKVAESSVSKTLLDKEIKIIYDFTRKMIKEFGTFIKTVALYGSFVRNQIESESDIDILILVDDASAHLTPKIMNYYEEKLAKILKQEGSPLELHANTLTLSEFWDGVRIGDPVIINMVREGIPVADAGFFSPVKLLLEKGKIRPSEEAIDYTMSRAYMHLANYKKQLLDGANELYWTVIDSGHALLMKEKIIPPTPREVPELLEKKLAKKGKMSKEDVKLVKNLYQLMKAITHGQIHEITGEKLDELDDKVEDYLERCKNELLEPEKKKSSKSSKKSKKKK